VCPKIDDSRKAIETRYLDALKEPTENCPKIDDSRKAIETINRPNILGQFLGVRR